ncbi:type II toxin-antitoxin system RelE/ParE family toxin [Aquiflexum sp. TKW24L]|uniref:type II toxin-antitoxin system RelE/ParE family toxin n=1 Tax=Aquiflexum sp. TKW24L TaxID=2942212 RepID=UPI0020C0052D|nr:type II toxin-antitoxin system RelE/ParE family toxin [Aquiflexum sp. TKW24L]MCL6260854.1 type II toxin-antitoxin system RelE/ParE family toxin [Aquiflexum sp. TKW24L]
MKYEVLLTEDFKRYFNRLLKKYPSLKNDLSQLIELLEINPKNAIPLGNGLFKIRLAIKSKNKGKSGGARVIYFLIANKFEIYLIHIFDKSEFENIPLSILSEMLKSVGLIK